MSNDTAITPTSGQPAGDDGPTTPDVEINTKDRRGALRGIGIALGIVVVLLILVKLSGGSPSTIVNNMVREAISPKTAGVAIAVIGLNLHFGYTGLLNFGQSGFMLLGAYGFAISLKEGLPLPLGILIGLSAALLFALLLGIPTLKLRGDYLAMCTIAAAEILRYVGGMAKLENFTGAAQGIPGARYQGPLRDLSFLPDDGSTFDPFAAVGLDNVGLSMNYPWTGFDGWWVRVVAWALVAAVAFGMILLIKSPWGRLLRGIREDEDAMRSLGKNVFALKMQSLVLGGMLGALGGMVYVFNGSVQPDSMARALTFFCWTALLLGGAATLFGPVLGTVLFYALRQFVQGTSGALVPDSIMNTQQSQQFSWIIVGVALMLLVIFRPQGILGDKRELRFNV